ncbi:CPBP family intramembrane glutamic endopeptidase [Halobacterium wangiae]|uniref:CPBP family intramembrane glutamic endopeptidase n=1 Tax=Halobacterium wangiae TaxID=2902623 RepID=UPI001E36537E|nr:CPBP family intramembrane glutamic endopeptidase [Halobacterium wangiae]
MATYWVPFAVVALALTAVLVVLTRLSAALFDEDATDLTSTELLVNTTASQVTLAAMLLVVGWLTGVPADSLGLAWSIELLAVGVGTGLAFAVANEALMRVFDAVGLGYDDSLREALTPTTLAGWLLLLFVALPVVAGFEELLFRGVLIGALSTGFGLSPWLLGVLSSVAFGAAHTAQGWVGVFVTTLLGLVLAAVYVTTGSLLVVFVAHYVMNAVEFVVHAD